MFNETLKRWTVVPSEAMEPIDRVFEGCLPIVVYQVEGLRYIFYFGNGVVDSHIETLTL